MNVLAGGRVPMVLSLRGVLRQWLDHRKDVLVRRTRHRLAEIARRIEVLGGLLIAYLNLDEVIRIIRESDEPKPALIARFALSDVQAEAILNMRLRSLRRLEEMEIRREHEALLSEHGALEALMASDDAQWAKIDGEIRDIRARFGKDTALGKRRTDFAEPPDVVGLDLDQAMIEKEPVTVVCSEMGWIRSVKGHLADGLGLTYKQGDRGRFVVHATTTDKVVLFASSGKAFTLDVARLPGGRGAGEPVRLMADMEASDAIVALMVHVPGRRLIVASSDGYGFIVAEDDCLATTRKGKQVMNVKVPAEVQACAVIPEGADHVAVVGENRKLLVFALSDLPQMSRGRGVRLQKYRDGGLSDVKAFRLAEGLAWRDTSGRTWTASDIGEWVGSRAQAGRLPPKGFPRSNRFA
jgi:topoisomerase-4 subunit A